METPEESIFVSMTRERKRGRQNKPRDDDRHAQPRLAFHLPEEMLSALDDYLADTRPRPGLSAVLRIALEDFLIKVGYWPRHKDKHP